MTKHQTTNARLADRRRFVGGSDARIIMAGDEAALIRLWKEKRYALDALMSTIRTASIRGRGGSRP